MSVPVAAWLGERLANPHTHKYVLGTRDRRFATTPAADRQGALALHGTSSYSSAKVNRHAPCSSGARLDGQRSALAVTVYSSFYFLCVDRMHGVKHLPITSDFTLLDRLCVSPHISTKVECSFSCAQVRQLALEKGMMCWCLARSCMNSLIVQ